MKFRYLVTVLALWSLLLPVTAKADGWSLKAEPGVAVPLTAPQSDRFHVGGEVKVQPLYNPTPWLGVGPSASFLVLPSDINGVPAGTAIGLGGGLMVRRPHDESNTGKGWSAVSPWVDADVQYVRTGELNRPGMMVGVGASVPTTESRALWVGPFARYEGVFQDRHPGYDDRSAKILIFGLSLEMGPRVHQNVPEVDSDHDGVPDQQDQCPYVPGPASNHGCPLPPPSVEAPLPPKEEPAPVPEVKFTISEKVQFLWDSSKIQDVELPALQAVVEKLLEHVDYNIRVEGHASSEGQVQHNNVLSQKRAESVVEYLVQHGVPRERLTAVGYGSSVPIADNSTKEGREANRRVEFTVTFVLVKGESK